jgi:hypothetical protein
MSLQEFIARTRNDVALFDTHCTRMGLTQCDDVEMWHQLMAEFFEEGTASR